MAETHNPLARFMLNRNHFLSPSKATTIGEKIQTFETNLSELEHAMRAEQPENN
jgi:hypothetical protein